MPPLHAGGVGHQNPDPVTQRRAHHRQGDARVAARALDDDGVGLQQPAAAGIEQDKGREPVLDRAARIEKLRLRVDRDAVAPEVERDQGRVADQAEQHGKLVVCHRLVRHHVILADSLPTAL